MKKFTKKASAVLLALVMTVCLVSTAFAANTVGTGSNPTDYSTKGVSITSTLNVAPGVAVPAETFTYKFKQDTTDTSGKYQTYSKAGVTTIADKTVGFLASDRSATATEPGKIMKQVKITLPSYDRAGVYKYTVTEVVPTTKTAGMTYDDNTYNMYVSVKNTTTGGVKVDNVIVVPTDGDNAGKKIDAGKTDTNNNNVLDYDPATHTWKEEANGFEFVNTFVKIKGDTAPGQDKDTPTPDGTPGITDGAAPADDGKIGVGDKVTDPDELAFGLTNEAANKSDSGMDLVDKKTPVKYTVNVTVPDTDGDGTPDVDKVPEGIIVDKDGKIIATVTPTQDPANPEKWTYKPVELADGQSFYIPNLPVGSEIGVSEKVPAKNTATYDGKNNGVNISETDYEDGDVVKLVVGDNGPSTVNFTNTYDNSGITPTGVILQNMPFVVMALIAVMGVALVVVSKRRRENEE